MELGGEGNIWLDAVSIDQSNHSEVATTVAVRGEYTVTHDVVSVLLPESDAPKLLHQAAENVMYILTYFQNSIGNIIDDKSSSGLLGACFRAWPLHVLNPYNQLHLPTLAGKLSDGIGQNLPVLWNGLERGLGTDSREKV